MIDISTSSSLPPVLAGPLLRRLEPGRLVLWLVGTTPLALTLVLAPRGGTSQRIVLDQESCRLVRIGEHAYIHLIDVALDQPLPQDTLIDYDVLTDDGAGVAQCQS